MKPMIDTKDPNNVGCGNLLEVPVPTPEGKDVEQPAMDSIGGNVENGENNQNFLGPHNWREKLKPVQSPIRKNGPSGNDEGERNSGSRVVHDSRKVKDILEGVRGQDIPKRIPSWKRCLIEKKKGKAAKTSPGVHRKNSLNRNGSVNRSGSINRSNSINRNGSINRGNGSFNRGESTFTKQVVNLTPNTSFQRKRVSPNNSFNKSTPGGGQLTKSRIAKVLRLRLYLLQQMGPNSFLIGGDSPDHKFRVIIGPQSCSCGKGPHCVHVLFVMLRVFQVSEGDPLLGSKTLKNYEVESLFRDYHEKISSRIQNRKEERQKQLKKIEEQAGTPSTDSTPAPSETDLGSQKEEDDTCPICLLEMLEGESLLKCEDGCQNRLHHHCIAVWFELCRRQNDPLICPLCRTKWKTNNLEVRSDGTSASSDSPMVPPNTRASSPLPTEGEERLPYAEPIPSEHVSAAAPWVELLGEDLVSCFFSKSWSIRESGLKHLGKETRAVLMRNMAEGRRNSITSPVRQDATHKMLECCCQILSFMCLDPVYKVYVASLRTLRTFLSYTPCRDQLQRRRLQHLLKPVIHAIIIKCTDGNRRTSQLSLSTAIELAKGQEGELAVGKDIHNGGTYGMDSLDYVVSCATEDYDSDTVSWQWLLGRLYVLERMFEEFQNELLPRHPPDGTSADDEAASAVEGATAATPSRSSNYERLLSCARFAVKAVGNSHMRVSRMARRVFFLVAKFSAHMDNIIEDLDELLIGLDSNVALSMKKRLYRIVGDFQLSEKIVNELHQGTLKYRRNFDNSPVDSPFDTPVSSPRCVSPVTVSSSHSDCQSEASTSSKHAPLVPPNTPIRGRKKQRGRTDKTDEAVAGSLSVPLLEKDENLVSDINTMPLVKDKVRSLTPSLLPYTIDQSPGKQSPPPIPPRPLSRTKSYEILNNRFSLSPPPVVQRINSSDIKNNNVDNDKNIENMLKDISLSDSKTKGKNAYVNQQINECFIICDKEPDLTSESIKHKSLVSQRLSFECDDETNKPVNTSGIMSISSDEKTISSDDSLDRPRRRSGASGKSCLSTPQHKCLSSDELLEQSCCRSTPSCTPDREKPVTFKTEVTVLTPKHSPSHTVSTYGNDKACACKEEVEREEAIALSEAMKVSWLEPPKPVVPGLTPTDKEQVITIRVQPDDYGKNVSDSTDNSNQPTLFLENVHWVKGPLLGTGAYSTCYQARDVKSGVIMAVKQISFCRNTPEEQEKVVDTITEEIHMMTKLNHPNIVRILGATKQGCHFNMFVEWMPAGSLASLLCTYGAFSENVMTSYTLQVLRGMAYLHDNHVLHRDLKGANLLVDSTGQRLRIGDFGAAARLASQATGAGEFQGQLLGTIAFMAPEVLRGENYGRACDMWSVGCCMIEMATARPPWGAKDISNHLALIFKIATSQEPPPIPDNISPPVRDLMLRCLEQKKEERPSAKDLLIHPLFTQYMSQKTLHVSNL
ncbi:mitogen-activated protein kinase kinase kinase 1-like isoform X2 [Pecten maximus]|uniref:mitogen-activated protein kinase kinase kinase 1-like isoform X2 n=1 Tax=Pecten maximus TaxID=6579 RepID=UPI001458DA17|nr:mitogen-activated protein kinase kinase kinase 1-like isoform X2 [Pecten maximus]